MSNFIAMLLVLLGFINMSYLLISLNGCYILNVCRALWTNTRDFKKHGPFIKRTLGRKLFKWRRWQPNLVTFALNEHRLKDYVETDSIPNLQIILFSLWCLDMTMQYYYEGKVRGVTMNMNLHPSLPWMTCSLSRFHCCCKIKCSTWLYSDLCMRIKHSRYEHSSHSLHSFHYLHKWQMHATANNRELQMHLYDKDFSWKKNSSRQQSCLTFNLRIHKSNSCYNQLRLPLH